MATLPDLDTANISFIAYWNAIDQGGVDDIDPTEVTSNGNVQSYTLYDNGVEGQFDVGGIDNWSVAFNLDDNRFGSGSNPATATFRVKEDGWMIAYLDRDNQFGSNSIGTPFTGGWNAFRSFNLDGNANAQSNNLARVIGDLKDEFSNSVDISYSFSDAGLYEYEYQSDVVTVLSFRERAQGGITSSTTFNTTLGALYTANTDIDFWWTTGASGYRDASRDTFIRLEGIDLVDFNDISFSDELVYGVKDSYGDNTISSPDTEYQTSLQAFSDRDQTPCTVKHAHVSGWS